MCYTLKPTLKYYLSNSVSSFELHPVEHDYKKPGRNFRLYFMYNSVNVRLRTVGRNRDFSLKFETTD